VLTIIVLFVSLNKFQRGLTLSCILEFPLIIGFSIMFLFLLTSTYDFFGVYLAIEGLSLTLYTLAGMLHSGIVSVEAAIKYYSLGAVSTGLLLFGISLIFGIVGALDFLEVQLFLCGSVVTFAIVETQLALLCVLFGFFFKVSAFPGHM
jgi:NADH-quinone oxidoreductase subunit N